LVVNDCLKKSSQPAGFSGLFLLVNGCDPCSEDIARLLVYHANRKMWLVADPE
jgi:hypothetical protein